MNNGAVLSKTQYENLLTRLSQLEDMMRSLLVAVREAVTIEPKHGSEAWWEWAHRQGMNAKSRGEVIRLETQQDLDDFFKKL